MRRLAAELGTGAMSLYNHLPNKAALLDAVAEYVLSDLEFATDPARDWREAARSMARTFRDVAHRYPRSVMVVVSRQPNSTVGMRPVELALATARAAGFDGRAAVQVMRAVVNYVLGCLVHEAGQTEARRSSEASTGSTATRPTGAEIPRSCRSGCNGTRRQWSQPLPERELRRDSVPGSAPCRRRT